MKAFTPIDNLVTALLTGLETITAPKPCRECATPIHLKLHLLPALAITDRIAEIAASPGAVEPIVVEPNTQKPCDEGIVEEAAIASPATDRTPTIERPSARVAVHRHYCGGIGGLGIGFDRKSSAKEWGDCLKLKADIYSYSIEESRFPEFKYELRSVSWDTGRLDKLLTYHFNQSPISHKPYREPEKKVRKPKLMSEQLAVA